MLFIPSSVNAEVVSSDYATASYRPSLQFNYTTDVIIPTTGVLVKGVGFLGLWTALSLFASPLIISDSGIYGILIYSGISLLFGIGFVFDVAGSGA